MLKTIRTTTPFAAFTLLVMLTAAWPTQAQTQAQEAKTPYLSMAPLEQYLMERNAEIALASGADQQRMEAPAAWCEC